MHLSFISATLFLTIAIRVAQSVDPVCEEPPDINFATLTDVSDETFSIGTTVTYSCQFGYVASGKSRILTCVRSRNNGQWTEPEFLCVPQSCGDPGYVTNGNRAGSLFTFPNSVTYHCDTGYKLRGIARRYCQTSGSWSGRLPTCEIVTCDPPKNPENGYVTASSYEYGSELNYNCDKGYSLSTDETIYCTEDGGWSRIDVNCIETVCKIPERPEYGYVSFLGTEERPRAGSIVIFSCEGDRIAYGPTTSKCLDIGVWTFPPPKCLEPCSIEYISNGVIGRYVKEGFYRRRVFKEAQLETRVEDDEDLYLRCSNGFEATGSQKKETKVTCSKGKWSVEPHCEPASCRLKTPNAVNAAVVDVDPKHGGTVSYRCHVDYKKVVQETVICDHGVWKGDPPTCQTTRCSVDALKFPGLSKGSRSSYRDGEVFRVTCEPRYRITEGNNGEIRCDEGTWNGGFPPCVAVNCSYPPPLIEHGTVKDPSLAHGSVAKYVCDYPYTLVTSSLVQCAFGEWEGEPPECKDSRCYLKDLKNLRYVSLETESITFSGDRLNVICEEGYSAKSKLPSCENGEWNADYASLCEESNCKIPRVNGGAVREETLGNWYWSWSRFRYERQVAYTLVHEGSFLSPGTVLWLYCGEPYSVHGSGKGREQIRCSEGRWSMDLVCLRDGERYVPTTSASSGKRFPSTIQSRSSSTMATKSVFPTTTPRIESEEWTSPRNTDKDKSGVTSTPFSVTEPPAEECFCEYPIDDSDIIAHADGKRLKYRDRVRDGSTVIFRCLHVGYHRFSGPQEITCNDCQPWHDNDFPSCTGPESGNTVIVLDRNVDVLPDGTIEIPKGESVNFTCAAIETAEYPEWNVSADAGVSFKSERRERENYGDVLYVTHLHIEKADYGNEGIYECFVQNNPRSVIHIIVVDPDLRCPEFSEDGKIIIEYEMERRERSKVFFTCPKKGQELIGKPELTCLRSKEWSDHPPYCTGVRCKKLKETDLLQIQYPNHREIDSLAIFHCFVPGKRSGVSFTKCLGNGSWEHPTPICRIPSCSVDDLLSAVPQNALPVTDNTNNGSFPYNSTVKLTCNNDMIAVGNPVAKCEAEAKWKVDKVQCASGCQPPTNSPGSKLKFSPEKDIYKFGDRLTFSCPPGMTLNTQSQVIMCLINGWSETLLPKCEEGEDYGDYLD